MSGLDPRDVVNTVPELGDARVHTNITEVQVSLLPIGHSDRHHWQITLVFRSMKDDIPQYAVMDGPFCFDRDGRKDYEISKEDRTPEYQERTRFPLGEALALAVEVLPTLVVNGWRLNPRTLEPEMTERLQALRAQQAAQKAEAAAHGG